MKDFTTIQRLIGAYYFDTQAIINAFDECESTFTYNITIDDNDMVLEVRAPKTNNRLYLVYVTEIEGSERVAIANYMDTMISGEGDEHVSVIWLPGHDTTKHTKNEFCREALVITGLLACGMAPREALSVTQHLPIRELANRWDIEDSVDKTEKSDIQIEPVMVVDNEMNITAMLHVERHKLEHFTNTCSGWKCDELAPHVKGDTAYTHCFTFGAEVIKCELRDPDVKLEANHLYYPAYHEEAIWFFDNGYSITNFKHDSDFKGIKIADYIKAKIKKETK